MQQPTHNPKHWRMHKHVNMPKYSLEHTEEQIKVGKRKKKNRPPIIHPISHSSASLQPLRSLETSGTGSDSSPPLMLACMNVKSLQASSAHPRWETLQEESSMSQPILACLPRRVLLFLLFVFSLSCLARLSWGIPINWPFICEHSGKKRERENTHVSFKRGFKKSVKQTRTSRVS